MKTFDTFATIDQAWVGVLAAAASEPDGRILHAVVAIAAPGPPSADLVALADDVLRPRKAHSVDTVASTLFPGHLYEPPDYDFDPNLSAAELQVLDDAGADLYETYREMLPELCRFGGNDSGTYFGRLVSWPGTTSDGYNQLSHRVERLRWCREHNVTRENALDLTVEGNAEFDSINDGGLGLQIYKSNDVRTQGFPCLVHLDISLLGNRLNLMAVYRHWHLINKAYGNLIGLTRLLYFLAQQTGYSPGELMIHATVANAQLDEYRNNVVPNLIADAKELLEKQAEVSNS